MMLLFTVQTPLSPEILFLIPTPSLAVIVLLDTFKLVLAIWIAPLPLLPLIVVLVMSNLAEGTVELASVSMAPNVLPLIVLSVIVVALTRKPDIASPKLSLLLSVLPMMCNVPER